MTLLNYRQALELILKHAAPLRPKSLPLSGALGRAVACDLFSPEPFPRFDNSAVDGYAVRFPTRVGNVYPVPLRVRGEIPAGKVFPKALKPGEAVQIFTGAPVPEGAEAVVMQEFTERKNGSVTVLKRPGRLENIRFRGEDFHKGRVLVRKGAVLTPAHLALLAAVGIRKVPAHPAPRSAFFATGNELLRSGEKDRTGKIRDSNSILLEALLRSHGALALPLPSVGDSLAKLHAAAQKGLQSDVLLIAGGISVGKYDFVRQILKKEGVREIFWKVNIKPGKPLFFGKKGRTLVFGLPGNPVSVFVTFEEFVRPALLALSGKNPEKDRWVEGRMSGPFQNGARLQFVRVRLKSIGEGFSVLPLSGQGSHQIGSLALADGLLKLEANQSLKKNERVRVKPIGLGR